MADPGILTTRAGLRAQGLGDQQVDRLLRNGRLVAVRRGVLIAGEVDLDVQVRAARTACGTRTLVASHLTAARFFGLPRPLSGWGQPEFTSTSPPGVRRSDLRITTAGLPPGQVVRLGDETLTSAARTVVDCLRTLEPRDGLAIADAALHARLVTAADLARVLASQRRWPGVRQARRLLALADARRESPLESWSALAFDQVGLPRPLWQVDLFDAQDRFIGRCDCWWPGVAGEADGKSKYRLAAAERRGGPAKTVYDVLDAERTRERAVREVRAGLERWSAADVLSDERAGVLGRRLLAAFALAAEGGPFLGRIALTGPTT